MPDESFLISFPGASTAEANQYASDLVATLRYLDEHVLAEQRRDCEEAQDFGATLALILGTASATAIANGMANWLARHSGARIEISVKGKVIATNLDSRDAAKIAQAFFRPE